MARKAGQRGCKNMSSISPTAGITKDMPWRLRSSSFLESWSRGKSNSNGQTLVKVHHEGESHVERYTPPLTVLSIVFRLSRYTPVVVRIYSTPLWERISFDLKSCP